MNGEGVLRTKDGSKYKGNFKDGMKNGKFIEENSDGLRFEGTYVNDIRDGAFVEKNRNGNIIRKGVYRMGRIEFSEEK